MHTHNENYVTETISSPQSLMYLLSGSFQEKSADHRSRLKKVMEKMLIMKIKVKSFCDCYVMSTTKN